MYYIVGTVKTKTDLENKSDIDKYQQRAKTKTDVKTVNKH